MSDLVSRIVSPNVFAQFLQVVRRVIGQLNQKAINWLAVAFRALMMCPTLTPVPA